MIIHIHSYWLVSLPLNQSSQLGWILVLATSSSRVLQTYPCFQASLPHFCTFLDSPPRRHASNARASSCSAAFLASQALCWRAWSICAGCLGSSARWCRRNEYSEKSTKWRKDTGQISQASYHICLYLQGFGKLVRKMPFAYCIVCNLTPFHHCDQKWICQHQSFTYTSLWSRHWVSFPHFRHFNLQPYFHTPVITIRVGCQTQNLTLMIDPWQPTSCSLGGGDVQQCLIRLPLSKSGLSWHSKCALRKGELEVGGLVHYPFPGDDFWDCRLNLPGVTCLPLAKHIGRYWRVSNQYNWPSNTKSRPDELRERTPKHRKGHQQSENIHAATTTCDHQTFTNHISQIITV